MKEPFAAGVGGVYKAQVSLAQDPFTPQQGADPVRRGRGLSLRTLVLLRWLAIAGQSATILFAHYVLEFPLPLGLCLAVIGASVAFNLTAGLRLRLPEAGLPDGPRTAMHLGFDILQLATLLALTGGLDNPFCILLIAPVTIAAASLPGRQAAALGVLVLLVTAVLFTWSLDLPWRQGEHLRLPGLYHVGMGLALVTGVVFTAGYAWRVAADAEKLELALATTQDVLQREQRLAALGGLAAAAAHELGTPLATIQIVAKELLRASSAGTGAAEDAALILQQAERCREILTRLSQQPEDGDALYADVGLNALLEEVVEPHRGFDLDFQVAVRAPEGHAHPRVKRLPEVIHGLSTIVENAADFATSTVRVAAIVDAGWITIEVVDDGPGFASDILPRLGEPYVTSRPQGKARLALAAQLAAAAARPGGRKALKTMPPAELVAPSQGGMGLGFFIARTLLERTGGEVSAGAGDGKGRQKGARVAVRWPRQALEVSQGEPESLT